jgi:LDH2 family malate/lactate/ureidoglycolate dehydrogenase
MSPVSESGLAVDRTVDSMQLRMFYEDVFTAMGLPPEHARTCAGGLIHADLRAIHTHGARSLKSLYVRMLREGQVNPGARPRLVMDRCATALVDGENGLGFVAASFAMREAVSRARSHGVGAVAVWNSSHCGSLGYYSAQAAEAGAIGLAATNLGCQGLLPPPGGRTRLLGTNAISAAAPAGAAPPFLLDMSTSVVAAGRIALARDRGERLPEGWLIDDEGGPLTDPQSYFSGRGRLQFLGGAPLTGGFKGYGLAILADILCGVLSGAQVGPNQANLEGSAPDPRPDTGIGHFMLAIDVTAFRPMSEFMADLDGMLDNIRDSEPLREGESVAYPGIPEVEHVRHRSAHGIPLSDPVAADLCSVAGELGLSAPVMVPAYEDRPRMPGAMN